MIRVPSPERLTAAALLGFALLLRLPYAYHYRFNSDEPQHLHVVWSWTQGLVQYRDVFDNHPPLFHVLMAPALAVIGERAEALPLMRLAQLPVWLAALVLTFLLAGRIYSRRVALWATVLLGVHFEFFFTSLEFRSDLLWAAAWLAALVILFCGSLTGRCVYCSGALLGVAMGVSQKTVLLASAVGGAALLSLALVPGACVRVPLNRAARLALTWLAGLATVPVFLAAAFAAAGALRPMLYCTVAHNLVPGMGAWAHPWRIVFLPIGLAAVLWLATPMTRRAAGDSMAGRRLVLLLAVAIYVLCVKTVWPFVTGQDWLPAYPVVAILLVGEFAAWAARRRSARSSPDLTSPLLVGALIVLIAGELAVLVLKGPVWRDRGGQAVDLVRETIRLTDPADLVIDAKGETVFRRRAWYWVLESVTRERLRRGMIADSLAEELVARRCRVATLDDSRFPPRARSFLADNFLPVGLLRVAGQVLDVGKDPRAPVRFSVAIPAEYTLVTESGPAAGLLDGTSLAGPRELAPGMHEFVAAGGPARLALVWAKAAARGFTPFGPDAGAP